LFRETHGIKTHLNIVGTDLKNYTGSADRLSQLNFPLRGFLQGLKDYI
jgi:hypothetical protein